jgi:hypothetical protein
MSGTTSLDEQHGKAHPDSRWAADPKAAAPLTGPSPGSQRPTPLASAPLFGGPVAPLMASPSGRPGGGKAPLARLAEDPKQLGEHKDLPAGMLTAALVAKTSGAAPAADGHGAARQSPTVLLTGITNGQKDADRMWQKLANTGGFAAPKDPHAVAAYGSIAEAPGWLGNNPTARNVGDAGLDVQAVSQYFHAAEGIQVDSSGHLKIDAATQKGLNAAHDNLGEKYVSAAELGKAGANQALSQLKPAPTFDPKTGRLTDEKAANQFISVLGHSGGGQGAFYTAIDLYQKGFKNVAVNGYEMALSPHERDVLEKIGVKVTNISGHLGDGAQVDSGIGETLKDAVGKGDPNYYDVNLKMDGKNPLGLHSIGDKAASMLMYSAWLDSQGRHHQFNDGSYKQWLAATGAQYGADQSAAKGSETAGFNRPQDLLDGARFTNRVPVSNNLADRSIQLGAGPLGASGNAYAGGQLGAAQGRWDGARGSGSVDNASVSFGASGQASALGRTLAGQVSGGAAVGHADGRVDLAAGTAGGSVDNARAQLALGGTRPGSLVGRNDQLTLGAGVDHASGNIDLAHGTAAGQFDNAQLAVHRTQGIHVLGNDLNLSYGGQLNASGGGSINAQRGQAQGSINLAGSSLDLGPLHLQAGNWAQAGAHVDLSQGQLEVNLAGHNIDVAGGVREGSHWLAGQAAAAGQGLSNGWHALTSHLPHF